MSSKTKYKCDFCKGEIVITNSSAGLIGFTMVDKNPTHQLHWNIDGPHICLKCINRIVGYVNKEL